MDMKKIEEVNERFKYSEVHLRAESLPGEKFPARIEVKINDPAAALVAAIQLMLRVADYVVDQQKDAEFGRVCRKRLEGEDKPS